MMAMIPNRITLRLIAPQASAARLKRTSRWSHRPAQLVDMRSRIGLLSCSQQGQPLQKRAEYGLVLSELLPQAAQLPPKEIAPLYKGLVAGDEVRIPFHPGHLDADSLQFNGLLPDQALQVRLPRLDARAVPAKQTDGLRRRRFLVETGKAERVIPAFAGRSTPVVHGAGGSVLARDRIVGV